MGMANVTRRCLRVLLSFKQARRAVLRRLPSVVRAGSRAICTRVSMRGKPCFKKTFEPGEVGAACFHRELLARQLFENCGWIAQIIERGPNWLVLPFYPQELRLDRVAPMLNQSTREEIATRAGWILLDILKAGYAHRDVHANNLYWVNGQLVLTDFETMEEYPQGHRPPLALSYDITGQGLQSPFLTGNMCYSNSADSASLSQVLKVPVGQVLEAMEEEFKARLREVSKTFVTRGRRHTCRAERIYSSFKLPYLAISKEESQRDSARRLERFGIRRDRLEGRTLLDLGSHFGGILFESQRLMPARCLGVEYDQEKVQTAIDIAAFAGLNNIEFIRADIDHVEPLQLGGPFDCVFCLAIEAHVKKKERLYRLLGGVTSGTLYFEGNGSTDPARVEESLRGTGFREIRRIGMCDDDCLSDNNNRPLFIAKK